MNQIMHTPSTASIEALDIANRIISGTFNFKAIKPGCDTVRISDGRFDIKF